MHSRLFQSLTIALLALTLVTACDSLRTIYVDVTSKTTVDTLPLNSTVFQPLGFDNFASFDVSSSAEFENSDASKHNIDESYVTGFVLEVTAPDDATLEFIDDLEVFIGQGDSDQRTRVAYLPDNTDTNVATLYLSVYDDRDISQYLRAESTVIEVDAKGRTPDQKTTIQATMTFAVKLQL